MPLWKVTGGTATNGLVVRVGCALGSECDALRLQTGSLVRELEIRGDRLHYELVSGVGPSSGWVSTRLKHKELLIRHPSSGVQAQAQNLIEYDFKATGETSVIVLGLAGEEIASLAMSDTATILTVKETLAPVCNVPPERQHLLIKQGPGIVGKIVEPLRDNERVAELGTPLTLQLVRLTERKGVLRLHVRGMWSLSGKQSKVTGFPETTWSEVKLLVERDTRISVEMQELQLPNGEICRDLSRLEENFRASDFESELPATIFLFARAHPDRADLQEKLKRGEISAQEVLAIDPDLLMPAC